jgi:hypothetical protein
MQIVRAGDMDWGANLASHRAGGMSHKLLFEGDEGSPDNFLFVLANEGSDYYSPRHRHAWDQVRLCLEGSIPIGKALNVDAGEAAYFPEGVAYGPQEGGPDRLVLLLQFGGASGLGYLSAAQLRAGIAELSQDGRFEKGVFRRERGEGRTNQDAYEAIWETVTGAPLAYPDARYKSPIVMRPDAFAWRDAPTEPGTRLKPIGRFPHRDLALDMVSLAPEARYYTPGGPDRRLIFAVKGQGIVAGQPFAAHTAIRLEPGEAMRLDATADTELFVIAYPLAGSRS